MTILAGWNVSTQPEVFYLRQGAKWFSLISGHIGPEPLPRLRWSLK